MVMQSCPRVARYLVYAIGLVLLFETVGSFMWISHISTELAETKAQFAAQQHAQDTLDPAAEYLAAPGDTEGRRDEKHHKRQQQKAAADLAEAKSRGEELTKEEPDAVVVKAATHHEKLEREPVADGGEIKRAAAEIKIRSKSLLENISVEDIEEQEADYGIQGEKEQAWARMGALPSDPPPMGTNGLPPPLPSGRPATGTVLPPAASSLPPPPTALPPLPPPKKKKSPDEKEDIGPPMTDLLWTILKPPAHNKLRTVPPDAPEPKEVANELPSADLYDTLDIPSDAENFTLLDFGSQDGGLSLKVARKHPTSAVVSIALCGDEKDAEELRTNQTHNQTVLAADLGADNNLICVPPTDNSPEMLLWWLYRQPVLFDYVFISGQAVEMLLENLLPHELEAVMARAIKLAKVVLVQSPGTGAADRYLGHLGDGKIESLLKVAAKIGGATELSVHESDIGHVFRLKSNYVRTVCLQSDVRSMGLFVGEGIARLDDDFREEIDSCATADAGTAKVDYKRGDDGYLNVDLPAGPCELDDRCGLHLSLYLVLQLGLGDMQRRALLSSALRLNVLPGVVTTLSEQFANTAASVFVQGTAVWVKRWVEEEDTSAPAEPEGEPGADGPCVLGDADHREELSVVGGDSNDVKYTVEHPAGAKVAGLLVCPDCTCEDNKCKHNSYGDTWELRITNTKTATDFVVHRVDEDHGWGYGELKVQYTVCVHDGAGGAAEPVSQPAEDPPAEETPAANDYVAYDYGGRRVQDDWSTPPSPPAEGAAEPSAEPAAEPATEGELSEETADDGATQATEVTLEENADTTNGDGGDGGGSERHEPVAEPKPEPEPEPEPAYKLVEYRITGADVTDEEEFDMIWPQVRRHAQAGGAKFQRRSRDSMLVYGNDHVSGLLAAKLARKMPTSTVVTIARTTESLEQHHAVFDSLGIQNVLLCRNNDHGEIQGAALPSIAALDKSPLRLGFQYIGSDIFGHAITAGSDFVDVVGKAITFAEVTFLEVPDPRVLTAWLNMLDRNEFSESFLKSHPYLAPEAPPTPAGEPAAAADEETIADSPDVEKSIEEWMHRLCSAFAAAGSLDADAVTIDVLPRSSSWGQQRRLVRIGHSDSVVHRSIQSNARGGHSRDVATFGLQNGMWVEEGVDATNAVSLPVQNEFMLSDLLRIGLLNDYKDELFMEYLDISSLGLALSMGSLPKPYALGLRCAKLTPALTYMSEDKLAEFCKGEVDGSTLVTETDLAVSTAGWLNAMDLPEANYSLLTYSADDGVGGEQMRAAATEAAARHPHSTVMSIMPHVKKFDDSLHKKNVTNLLPLRNTPSDDLIGRIYRSPEFFQYQMMGNILHFMHDMDRDTFETFLEHVLSIASTTFYSMPSSELLSAATETFYDIAPNTFRWAEKKLLLETIHSSHHLKTVAMSVTASSTGSSIVRVETRNMTRVVHHHFDYEIDGHQRTYRMHSEGPHKVWLTREEDDSKIPYTVNGQPIHFGMTLISILRLGVTDEIRDELYASFLKMSLYEDMAPWNIFYEAGKLIYIDYDTRNLVFDEAVKTAYQVIEVLMNYKRTVEDFKRCDGKAQTKGWLPHDKTGHIAECVSSDFDGPCDNPAKPVPCGDKTCRHTYVDCLKALYALEMTERSKTASPRLSDGSKSAAVQEIKSKLVIEEYTD